MAKQDPDSFENKLSRAINDPRVLNVAENRNFEQELFSELDQPKTDSKKGEFEKKILKELTDPYGYLTEREVRNYRSSEIQDDDYKSVVSRDLYFEKYIKQVYGDYTTFLQKNKIKQNVSVYDPMTDYLMDVTIVKPEAIYKTDHISPHEMIMENLTGVCSIWFIKRDGNSRRLNCTLQESLIPGGQEDTRERFFSPMKNGRIGVWDINTQSWKSFYIGNAFKFVRDDSTSME